MKDDYVVDYVVARGFVRNYRGHPVENRHSKCHFPYAGLLHGEESDQEINLSQKIHDFLSEDVPEGEIVEIIVRRTNTQSPLADDPWVRLEPHTYGPNSKSKKQ